MVIPWLFVEYHANTVIVRRGELGSGSGLGLGLGLGLVFIGLGLVLGKTFILSKFCRTCCRLTAFVMSLPHPATLVPNHPSSLGWYPMKVMGS